MANDDYCYDPTYRPPAQLQNRTVAPKSAPVPQQTQQVLDAIRRRDADYERRSAQVLYLTLLSQGGAGGPVTEVTQPYNGDFIEADYKRLFTNNTNNPVRAQVFAEFTTPGAGVNLSLTADRSDVGKFDVLALTANGRTESVTVIVPPTTSIWARDLDPVNFPMQDVDVLRIRIFDPMKLLSFGNLYPEFQKRF